MAPQMTEIFFSEDLNELVPEEYRKKLNEQPCKMRNEGKYYPDGRIKEPFIYVLGLGERHYKAFDKEIIRLTNRFPWTKKKHIRFIMNELVINTQFSMLRELVLKVKEGKQAAGYFNVVIYACADFFSAAIEEFGDFFDYYGYLDSIGSIDYNDQKNFDSIDEAVVKDVDLLAENHIKLILTNDNDIRLADGSNKIGLTVIERATDQDFYVTSFYKSGKYMWKRIYFRVENN